MSVSWAQVVELLGLEMAGRLDRRGLCVMTDEEADALERFSKIAEVALPILAAIANRDVPTDDTRMIAESALKQIQREPIPTPSDDLRIQLHNAEARNRQACSLIRELLTVVRVRGTGKTLALHSQASKFLRGEHAQ